MELLAFQATFAKYDKNGDGGLTEEEWYEVMRDSGSDISRYKLHDNDSGSCSNVPTFYIFV